ncbi:MAG: pyruvate kinase alpha/beta domain-containing protein, partial [Pseudomonadota bacterium]
DPLVEEPAPSLNLGMGILDALMRNAWVLRTAGERFKLAVVSAARAALDGGFATEEDYIVVTAGVPFNVPGTTNILRVAPCDERKIYAGEPE